MHFSRFVLLFMLLGSQCMAQIGQCDATILVDFNFREGIPLFAEPGGKVINQLRHNFIKEDFLILDVDGKNDSMFRITASYGIDGFISKGWIKNDNPSLVIFVKAYSRDLVLYRHPTLESEISSIVKKELNPADYTYHVLDCHGKWLYIRGVINGAVFSGWISPDMQCANQYTTCNYVE